MRYPHVLLAVAYPILAVLGFGPRLTWLYPALCLAVLILAGELWLRALVRQPVEPVARLGLATASGLVTLPLIALVLHVLSVRIEGRSLAVGLAAMVTVLGAYVIVRDRKVPAAVPDRRPARTLAAVAVPVVLALVTGGGAVLAYQRLPHPAEPGYTSLALDGWAAEVRSPVAFPAAGLTVPIRVSSEGQPATTVPLRVQVGDRVVAAGEPVVIGADAARSVEVHVPAPPDGCLHLIKISLGEVSTVFYGRGPAAC